MLSREAAGIAQRPRKMDLYNLPMPFNTEGEPRSEIQQIPLLLVGCIVLKRLLSLSHIFVKFSGYTYCWIF